LDEYRALLRGLTPSERAELIEFLSGRNPADYVRAISELPPNISRVARFYIPLTRSVESKIREVQRARLIEERTAPINMTPEEIVEDAGLEEEAEQIVSKRTSKRKAA